MKKSKVKKTKKQNKSRKTKILPKKKISRKPSSKNMKKTAAGKEKKDSGAVVFNFAQTSVPVSETAAAKTGKNEFEIKKTKIKIIGIGGGGGNIIAEIASKVKKSSFIAVNTDSQALEEISSHVTTFQLGERFTHGLGTGMDAQTGEEAAKDEKEKIKKMLEGQDLVILVASLGGGAGSGAVPVFAQISKSLGNLTYGIFTLPFAFEGSKKKEIARNALEKLKPNLNALTIVPNENVFKIVPKTTPFNRTLSHINKMLSDSLQGLIETIFDAGLVNIDFADLQAILSGQGKLSFLSTVEFVKGESGGAESYDQILSSPFYPYDIQKARGVLLNIAGSKDLKLSEVNHILSLISSRIHKEAKIIFGVSQGFDSKNSIKATILATGCQDQNDKSSDSDANQEPPSILQSIAPAAPKSSKKKPPKKKINKNKKKKVFFQKPSPKKNKTNPVAEKKSPEPKKEEEKPAEDNIEVEIKKQAPEQVQAETFQEMALEEGPVRKNAIQVKKDIEEEEKEMIEQEKAWEIPAFLRKKLSK